MAKGIRRYFIKFTILHVITYTLFGVLFYYLQNYELAFDTQEYFKLFRPMTDPIVSMAPFIQLIRGGLLALFLYPLHNTFIEEKHGWLLLFLVLFGFTALVPGGMITDFIKVFRTENSLSDFLVGVPEISVQMLVFSFVFVKWQRRGLKAKE